MSRAQSTAAAHSMAHSRAISPRGRMNRKKFKCAADLLAIAIPFFMVIYSNPANAKANCFCQAACQDNTGHKAGSVKGYLRDITVVGSYSGVGQQSDTNQTACNTECTTEAAKISKATLAQQACQKGCASGSPIMAWSKVGTREWKSAQGYGALQSSPANTVYTCPAGWFSNTTNIEGGQTGDGKCKKKSGDNTTVTPLPPNGTPLGTWGFTWGTEIIAYGTAANGGAPTTSTTPGICNIP